MPLAKTKDILNHATENKFGVLAAVTFNFETIKWAVKAAEIEKVPLILLFYPGFSFHIPQDFMAYMATRAARASAVPVAVHLDHSPSYEIAVGGIKDGFSSIMVDGSSLPFEENVALTASVVRAAGVFGVDVEAELGLVGSGGNLDDMTNQDLFTDPTLANDFINRTGCDALAIAVGNAHGAYVKTPELDFERIKAVRKAVAVPLVMHGSSGIPDEQLQEAVNQGMSKFNMGTEYFKAFYDNLKSEEKSGDALGLLTNVEEPIIEFLRSKIRLLNPNKFSL